MKIKELKRKWKMFICDHKEWDCDTQIRTLECKKCGKRAILKDYRNLYDK